MCGRQFFPVQDLPASRSADTDGWLRNLWVCYRLLLLGAGGMPSLPLIVQDLLGASEHAVYKLSKWTYPSVWRVPVRTLKLHELSRGVHSLLAKLCDVRGFGRCVHFLRHYCGSADSDYVFLLVLSIPKHNQQAVRTMRPNLPHLQLLHFLLIVH